MLKIECLKFILSTTAHVRKIIFYFILIEIRSLLSRMIRRRQQAHVIHIHYRYRKDYRKSGVTTGQIDFHLGELFLSNVAKSLVY